MKQMTALLLSCFALATSYQLTAQSKELENVVDIELKSSIAIKNNGSIVGYALFYKVDKMKKAALYRLEVLDENLKSIGSNEFEGSKELGLTNAVYESNHIMLSFHDPKKMDDIEYFVKIFDLKGKSVGQVNYDPEKVKKGMMGKAVAQQMTAYYNGVSNVEGKGFVAVYQSQAKTGGVDIQFITAEGKLKWEQNFTAEKGDREDMYLVNTSSDAIQFFMGERGSIRAKESKNFLLGIDPVTGKQLYKKPLQIGEYAYEPQYFKYAQDGSLKMLSIITNDADKFYSARPVGFSVAALESRTGEFKIEKDFIFENDLGDVLNMKTSTKSEDGFMQIHDINFMDDGSKVVVGEFFRRTVSALGVASTLLLSRGGQAHTSQISIGDGFLLHINKNDKVVSLDKLDKKVQRYMPPGDGLSLGLLQRVMKMDGAFGYVYTDESPDRKAKTAIFEGTFEGERYGTNAVTYDEKAGYKIKKLTVDAKGRDRVRIMRAKPGHVMVMKYTAKEKKVTLNLERVD